MRFGIRNAQTLFDKITQRNSCLRNLISSSYSTTTSCCESIEYEEPTEIFRKTNNVISWTAKISTLLRKNQPKEAIGLFKAMLFDDQKPNFVTLLSIIRAYGACSSQDGKRVVHGYVIKMGFEREVPVLTALLGFYSNFGMGEVWKLFDQIPNKDVVVWTSMIVSCTKNDNSREAIEVFRRMKCCGVEPNFVTVVSVLPACAHLGQLRLGKEIHGFIMKNMLHSVINIQNSLVDMYAKCGDLESSFRVFDGTWNRELITWRIIIRGCIDNGCPRKGLDIFLKMLLSCSGSDEVVLQDVIAATSLAEELKFGLGCHVYAAKAGFLAFVSVGTALLQMYGKYGDLRSAWKLLNELSEKDNIAWNAMISVYAQEGQPQNALNVLKQMVSQNEKPDEVSFVSLLKACSSTGDQALGESFHGYIIKAGYTSNAYLASALIDLYCKLGNIEEGEALFNEISTKDLICWSSMITGYGSNGCAYEALETFSKMLDCGIKPNDIVFLSVLSASSRGGLKNESFKLFNTMQQKFGLRPKLAHYACMVDLLCRHGNIKEAVDFVKNMPLEADKRIWGAILSGCRTRQEGSIEAAEYAVERLSTLDPGNPSIYNVPMHMEPSVNSMETKKGILEILLVQAEGIRHTNLLGRPAYYVIVQCGTHLQRSKVTRGKDEKAWWNQKFVFEFPLIDWKHQTHLKLRIMDKEFLSRGGFVGETIIYIGGIISEGIEKGNLAVKPSSYNVVLEDDTFKGEIKIGFKFLASKEVSMETKSLISLVNNQPRRSVSRSIRNLWNFSWWRFWFYCNRTIHACK